MGVEAVTPEGLKAVFKDFNYSGNRLVKQLQTFREHGVHVLGSFIFGLPTDKPETFEATADLAKKAGRDLCPICDADPVPRDGRFRTMGERTSGEPDDKSAGFR